MADLKKKITKEYEHAGDKAGKKLGKYLSRFESEDEKKRKEVERGDLSEQDYKRWRTEEILTDEDWPEQRDEISKGITMANVVAMALTFEAMMLVFAENYNYGIFEAEQGAGIAISYEIFDRNAAEALLHGNPTLLPPPKVDIPKDIKWNAEHLTSAILQGILSGQSIPDIAKNLDQLTGMGLNAALRNARTMMTAAQNSGRIESYRQAEELGIEVQKMWLAEMDDRVRESHAELNGETVGIDEEFSNGLQYPADPNGEPEEVYNCRCTLVAQVKGHEHEPKISYEDWKEGKRA